MAAPLLKFVRIPAELIQLDIASKTELLILALVVAFGDKGLTMSNASLAKFLNVDKGNIVRAIQHLRHKGYIVDAGADDYHRKLVPNSSVLPLSTDAQAQQTGCAIAPQIDAPAQQNRCASAHHNRIIEIKKKKEKVSVSSSKIDWDEVFAYNARLKEEKI